MYWGCVLTTIRHSLYFGVMLLNHIAPEDVVHDGNSYIEILCPVCKSKGIVSKGLKINKKTGAYKAWICGCSADSIRRVLGLRSERSNYSREYITTTPLHLSKIDPLTVSTYKPRITNRVYTSPKRGFVKETVYYYGVNHRVVRLDLDDGNKEFYFNYLHNNTWKYQDLDTTAFPLFNAEYITEKKVLVVVEGEKAAHSLTSSTGLLSITPPGFGWTESYLLPKFQRLYFKISGLAVISDNDTTGYLKAATVEQAAWKAGIPTKRIDLKKFYVNEGDDVVDILFRTNANELREYICK
jgi:hypothetical protein